MKKKNTIGVKTATSTAAVVPEEFPTNLMVVCDGPVPTSERTAARFDLDYSIDLYDEREEALDGARHRIAALAEEREGGEVFRAVVVTYAIAKIEYVTEMPDGSLRTTAHEVRA